MPAILSFTEAIAASAGGQISVLLGNGFSIAQAGGTFGYTNLLERSGLRGDSPVRTVFKALGTVDFEEVMHALELAAKIEEAYGYIDKFRQFQADADGVREALIHSIRAVHPQVHFDIPDQQVESCAAFLRNFDVIFTLNYDLLMYWVMLKSRIHSDGFGLGQVIDGFRTFQIGAHCTTNYLHGALHLFLAPNDETKKHLLIKSTLIDDIAATIRREKKLPLFVAEGTTTQKLRRIKSVPYLNNCYEKLSKLSGTIVIFGHSVADNDIHIYDAIFESNVDKVFFCVHNTKKDWSAVREKLARFEVRRKDIRIRYVDAASARIWGS